MTNGFRTVAILSTIFLLVLGSTVSANPTDEPLFLHPRFVTQPDTIYLTGADLDEDGQCDLVVGGLFNREFIVALGWGNGFFDTSDVSTDIVPMYPAVADLNSDGVLDLAVAPYDPTNPRLVGIYLGHGDGSFQSPAYYPVNRGDFVTTGDFNEDDHPDLLFPGGIMLNNGNGTFGGMIGVPCGANFSIIVADFNGDEKDDYATPNEICLGDGTGTFTPSDLLSDGEYKSWVTAGDLNGDEIPDVVVTFLSVDEIAVLLGDGDGTFGPEQRYAVGNSPRYVSIEDIDKDGSPDVAVSNCCEPDRGISLLYGTGDGSLEPAVDVTGVSNGHSLVVEDFNHDGLNDLAMPSWWNDDVRLVLADGPRSFPTNPSFATGDGGYQYVVAVGDVDADGRADLAVVNADSDDVSILVGNGAGTFAPEIRVPVGVEPSALVFAQLTSDTNLDLAVTNSATDDVSILAGNGDGTFTALAPVRVGRAPSSIVSGDLNDDGKSDLAVTNTSHNTVSVLLGNGDGTFGLVFPPTAVGTEPSDLALGDFNGDTRLDLVTSNHGSDDFRIHLGNGNGTFTPGPSPYIYRTGAFPTMVEVADLDGDGSLDFMISASGTRVHLGNGDATFTGGTFVGYGPAAYPVDLDGDGILDHVGSIGSIRLGNGDGTFGNESSYALDSRVAATGDFDLDGHIDLVGDTDSKVRIALNRTGPKALNFLADDVTLTWPSVLGALRYDVYRGNLSALVDLDHDGLPDDGYGVCLSELDADTRDTFFVDTELPTSSGAGFFYLHSVIDAQGDSGLGNTSAGQPRLPQVPCS